MEKAGWTWILPGVGVVDVCLALKPGIVGSMPIVEAEMIMAEALLPISDDFDGGKHGERASNEAREKGDRNG